MCVCVWGEGYDARTSPEAGRPASPSKKNHGVRNNVAPSWAAHTGGGSETVVDDVLPCDDTRQRRRGVAIFTDIEPGLYRREEEVELIGQHHANLLDSVCGEYSHRTLFPSRNWATKRTPEEVRGSIGDLKLPRPIITHADR